MLGLNVIALPKLPEVHRMQGNTTTHLSLCRSTILSVCSRSFWEMRVFRASAVSPRGTVSSTGLPVVEVMHTRMEGWPVETPAPPLAYWEEATLQRRRGGCCSIQKHRLLKDFRLRSCEARRCRVSASVFTAARCEASLKLRQAADCTPVPLSLWQAQLYSSSVKKHPDPCMDKPRPHGITTNQRETQDYGACIVQSEGTLLHVAPPCFVPDSPFINDAIRTAHFVQNHVIKQQTVWQLLLTLFKDYIRDASLLAGTSFDPCNDIASLWGALNPWDKGRHNANWHDNSKT